MKNKRAHIPSPHNFFSKNRKGTTLLIENIIFIILNLVFIAILVFFLLSRSGTGAILEEKYAKEIALMLDSAKPGMIISLNMEDAIKIGKEKRGEENIGQIVTITGNVVNVNLQGKNGYSYSFFNDVTLENKYLNEANNEYVMFIGDYSG